MLDARGNAVQHSLHMAGTDAAGRQRQRVPKQRYCGSSVRSCTHANLHTVRMERYGNVAHGASSHSASRSGTASAQSPGLPLRRNTTQNPKTIAQCFCTQPATTGKQNGDHPKCIARSSASIAVLSSIRSSAIVRCRWSVRELLAWQETECAAPHTSLNTGTNRK